MRRAPGTAEANASSVPSPPSAMGRSTSSSSGAHRAPSGREGRRGIRCARRALERVGSDDDARHDASNVGAGTCDSHCEGPREELAVLGGLVGARVVAERVVHDSRAAELAGPDDRMPHAVLLVLGDPLDHAVEPQARVSLVEDGEVPEPVGDHVGADDVHARLADRPDATRSPRSSARRARGRSRAARAASTPTRARPAGRCRDRGRRRARPLRRRAPRRSGSAGSPEPSGSGASGLPAFTTSRSASPSAASPAEQVVAHLDAVARARHDAGERGTRVRRNRATRRRTGRSR